MKAEFKYHPQESEAKACGKAILVGEHAVVYGATAVAMPILNRGVRLSQNGQSFTNNVHAVLNDGCRLLGIDPQILNKEKNGIETTLPLGAGLGGSASLCVMAIRYLADLSERKLPTAKICEYANELEKRFHGNPSGLDTAVVAYETMISFSKNKGTSPIQVSGDWNFLLIDSTLRASTKAMIQTAKNYFDDTPPIETFNKAAKDTIEGLKTGNIEKVASAMNFCSDELVKMGVVPKHILKIISKAMQAGSLASKITGAGGGGMILCLCRDSQSLAELSHTFNTQKTIEVSYP